MVTPANLIYSVLVKKITASTISHPFVVQNVEDVTPCVDTQLKLDPTPTKPAPAPELSPRKPRINAIIRGYKEATCEDLLEEYEIKPS